MKSEIVVDKKYNLWKYIISTYVSFIVGGERRDNVYGK